MLSASRVLWMHSCSAGDGFLSANTSRIVN